MEQQATYYIPATNAPSRSRRTLKHNDTFAVFDSHGDLGASAGGGDGLFHCDTRYLSHLELMIDGMQPLLLHSTVSDQNLNYHVDLTNPDLFGDGHIVLLKDTAHISRTMYLCNGSLRQRIAVRNHSAYEVAFLLTLTFGNDFADLFEVRGIDRARRGYSSAVRTESNVRLTYVGLDEKVRHSTLEFEPLPTDLSESVASYQIVLAPDERRSIFVNVVADVTLAQPTMNFFRGMVALTRDLRTLTRQVATVETSNSTINDILCRSMADMYMLITRTADGIYPYAGIPWYSTTFGRDGIIAAMQMLWVDPAIARGVLKRLARLQADTFDDIADAAPGKILHELRGGEMAALGEVPFRQYYGTVDATPLFVMLAGHYLSRTGDVMLIRQLWPVIERALAWLDGPGDADKDGWIEYERGDVKGLANQGWKDSHDSIFHADGSLASGPIALVEVQGYAYAARIAGAACALAIGRPAEASALTARAEDIRSRFEVAFWCDELEFYALALDGAKAPCRVLTSNPGHILSTGIADPQHAARVATRLMQREFFSGWGVRTVAAGQSRYNPMSYHNGSVWPHDNALLACGLAQLGHKSGIIDIFEGLMRAASYLDQRRIPELFCGFRRKPARGPTLYPAACSPQAWAASTPFSLVQSLLGLEFRLADHELRLNRPVVPPMAGSFTLRNVTLGDACADFTVHAAAEGHVALEVHRTRGDIHIALTA